VARPGRGVKGIGLDTIGLLTGMMILVRSRAAPACSSFSRCGRRRAAKAHPAASCSFCKYYRGGVRLPRQVTTVLLIVPVTLAICKTLKVPGLSLSVRQIIASNIGGTATLMRSAQTS